MSEQRSAPRILDGLIKAERSVLEQMRGPALVFLTKIKDFVTATAQPVINIQAGNRTAAAGPTPDAPMLVWGAGGFELSTCLDQGDSALSLPLETDHAAFYASGKVSDPATPRLHDRGLAVSLPFRFAKAVAAGAGEVYLGHPGKGLYLKISREALLLELQVAGVGAKIKIGKDATLAAARETDTVDGTAGFLAWANGVAAAAGVAAFAGSLIGRISSGSGTVTIV